MKSAIILLAFATLSFAKDSSSQPQCRYTLTVSSYGAEISQHAKRIAAFRSVEELKRYIETISSGCTIQVWFEVPRSEFSDAYPELKTLCEARQIKLVQLLE